MNKIDIAKMHKAVMDTNTVFCIDNKNYEYTNGDVKITNKSPNFLYEKFRIISYIPTYSVSDEMNMRYINFMIRKIGVSYLQDYLKHIGIEAELANKVLFEKPKTAYNLYMEKYRMLKEKYPERKNLWNDIVRVGLYIVGETSIYNVKDYDAFLALIERIYLVIDDIIKDIHPTEFYNRIDMIRIVKEILKENNLPVSLASPCRWCGWYCIDSMHGMYDPKTLNRLIHALCKFIKENKKD